VSRIEKKYTKSAFYCLLWSESASEEGKIMENSFDGENEKLKFHNHCQCEKIS
jgi:hypothetical protein